MAFEIKTDTFEAQGNIPIERTCDGKDLSPALHWQNPPANTKSFALIMDDPDVAIGTWVHWVVYDIPVTTNSFEAGLPNSERLADEAKQGLTDFQRTGYDGPCPPPGKPHRYYFKLYALDTLLNLPSKQTKVDLLAAMYGHILAEIRLMGKYERKKDSSAKPEVGPL